MWLSEVEKLCESKTWFRNKKKTIVSQPQMDATKSIAAAAHVLRPHKAMLTEQGQEGDKPGEKYNQRLKHYHGCLNY